MANIVAKLSREKVGVTAAGPRREPDSVASMSGAGRGMPAFLQGALQASLTSGANAAPADSSGSLAGAGSGAITVDAPNSRFEREAESIAASVAASRTAPPHISSIGAGATTSSRASFESTSGHPLRADQREFFAARLGHDFDDVRIHHDAESDRLNEVLSARAVTRGSEIFFRGGEYDPESAPGRELLAHELVHVVQQRGGGTGALIQRAPNPTAAQVPEMLAGQVVDNDTLTTDADLWSQVFAAACQKFLIDVASATELPTKEKFEKDLAELIVSERGEPEEAEKNAIQSTAADVAKLEQDQPPRMAKLTIPGAFHALVKVRKTGSASAGLLAFVMSRRLGFLFAGKLDGMTPSPVLQPDANGSQSPIAARSPLDEINEDLTRARMALTDESSAVQLELEGTVALLIDRRRAFINSKEISERKSLAAEIGTFSRQALLLNGLMEQLYPTASATPTDPTELDNIMTARAGEMDELAEAATDEALTLGKLGDDPRYLTLQDAAAQNPMYPGLLENRSNFWVTQYGAEIRPEQAFPEILDLTENEMLRNLEERVQKQREEVARLRAGVIPASARYTLEEFAQVFRRWAAFFSVEQEIQDPILKMNMEMLGAPYRLFGSAALGQHPSLFGKVAMVEGAIARHFLMQMVVDQLDRYQPLVSSMQPQLGRNAMGKQSRHETVRGDALSVDYQFAQLFAGSPGGMTTAGEVFNRAMRSQTNREETAKKFTATADAVVKEEPGLVRILTGNTKPEQDLAVQLGIAPDANVPLVGLRKVDAREGWSSLVDIYEPNSVIRGFPIPIEREHKILPTEVVDYLLAVEQHRATLAKPHQPKVGGKIIGDAAVRGKGLEETGANNAAYYREGALSAPASDDSVKLSSTRGAAMSDIRGMGVDPTDTKADPTAALLGSLMQYFTAYFSQKEMEETPKRIATVLVIAANQYGAAEQAAEVVRPGRIAAAVADALQIHGIIKLVSSLGNMGKLLGRGIGAYFSVNGISDLAAIQGMLSFFMIAAEADDFAKARVRAKLVANFLADAQELVDSLATKAATHAVDIIASRLANPPKTARELADFCGPIMENPKSRAELMAGVDAQMRELESQRDFDRLQPSEEYRTMQAFREQLQAKEKGTRPPHNPDADLPLKRDRQAEEASDRMVSRRTDSERLALKDALGPHRDLPIVENPNLGNGVRIHYDGGFLRVEVGPNVKPDRVSAHQNTIQQLKRYNTPMGRVVELIKRAGVRVGLLDPSRLRGTQANEARMEIEKLDRMISDLRKREAKVNERASQLSANEKLAVDPAIQKEITRDIAGFEAQIARYETHLNSPLPGKGFIASGDTTKLAAEVKKAEGVAKAKEADVTGARKKLTEQHTSQRAAEARKERAINELAEAKALEDSILADSKSDAKVRAEAKALREQAAADAKLADAELKRGRNEIARQKKEIAAAEVELHKARDAEVVVAKKELETQLSDLYRERVDAWRAQTAAESVAKDISQRLSEAQAALQAVRKEQKNQVPDVSAFAKDQQTARLKEIYEQREASLAPLKKNVDDLSAEHAAATKLVTEARARRDKATKEINSRVSEFEIRQAAAAGITRATYEMLRGRTPSSARQSDAQARKVDAIYGTPILGTPQADHIVPMYEIVRMPGFNRLDHKTQEAILNDAQNFWALDARVNASKGHRSLTEWRGHPDAKEFPRIDDKKFGELLVREKEARDYLLNKIATLAGEPTTKPDEP